MIDTSQCTSTLARLSAPVRERRRTSRLEKTFNLHQFNPHSRTKANGGEQGTWWARQLPQQRIILRSINRLVVSLRPPYASDTVILSGLNDGIENGITHVLKAQPRLRCRSAPADDWPPTVGGLKKAFHCQRHLCCSAAFSSSPPRWRNAPCKCNAWFGSDDRLPEAPSDLVVGGSTIVGRIQQMRFVRLA